MTNHHWLPTLSLALLCVSSSATAADEASDTGIRGANENRIEVLIPAVDGLILWRDVASGLGDALKLDAETIQKMLPSGQLDLRSDAVVLVLMGINLATGQAVTFDLVRDEQNRPALLVRCKRNAFGSLRGKNPKSGQEVEIELDDDWKERSADRPLVICLHGLQSRPGVFNGFRKFLRAGGYATAAVAYDHQQSIALSAKQLSMTAEQVFGTSNASPRLALVGHSMGGLVAREWTENEALASQRIVSLITIGTPHGGSNWASLPPLLDLFTSGDFDAKDFVDVILHQPSAPGLRDLIPGSDFLERLASRPRRPNVAYTTIVGTGSPIEESQVARLRETLQRLDRNGGAVRLIRPRIQPLLESFDELARGKGDGVVAVSRATIEGNGDVEIVDLSHFELIRPILGSGEHPVWKIVIERLQK